MTEHNNVSNINYTDISKITGLFSAKGDLLTANGSITTSLLPVGSDGQLLTADSTQPTGLAWNPPQTASLTDVNYQEFLPEQSTSVRVPTYTTAATFNVNVSGGSTYYLEVRYKMGTSSNNRSFAGRVLIDGTTVIMEYRKTLRISNGNLGTSDNATEGQYSDFKKDITLSAGAHTFEIQFSRGTTSGSTMFISDIYVLLYKI